MIACLYGSTCAGKTTIARFVAEQLILPLRSCGEEIHARATSFEVHAGPITKRSFLDAVFANTKPREDYPPPSSR